ncbi:hypothetical protein D9757_002983 [Collybiopsis confluens]|uniref:phosphoacetylglucosamine mutase n=1 Tax=Collybiopsis confluens TaxID=2823264 RepID=A0A8H5HVH1_9AGAR|nr:hypothetical protein D9757_002983 [Collybiopsis confluens]
MSLSLPVHSIKSLSDAHPKPNSVRFQYGTAGFRTIADTLDSVLFRVGIIAALRSKKLDGKTIGVMVTASHNPEPDNGVKLVDPRGEMLEASWEAYSTSISNAPTSEALIEALEFLVQTAKIDLSKPANVVYARDTRPSGPALVSALEDGLKAVSAITRNAGVTTTPILHYLVKAINTKGTKYSYGDDSEQGYFEKLSKAYKKLVAGKAAQPPLVIDCANGVGALAGATLSEYLNDTLEIILENASTTTPGALNNACGADFVKVSQKLPPSLANVLRPGQRACSFDGDADRLIYFYLDDRGVFHMLDGDKIAALVAAFIVELVKVAGLEDQIKRLPVKCVPTGVKHLHHAAERYNVGVYFEANGHGTVLFSQPTLDRLSDYQPSTPAQSRAVEHLVSLTELINQTVGDALSDTLLVEVVLAHKSYRGEEWDSLYADLPNRLAKVSVPDRNVFKTEDAERRLTSPPGLQAKIDELVNKSQGGRSFVRPSGTEDVVRVYAEAGLRSQADELAMRVAGLVYDEAGGDPGNRPKEFFVMMSLWRAVSNTARSITVAQILLFLPLTLSTLSQPAFLLLSLLLALHSVIHGTLVLLWGSPNLSVLQVPIHPFLLLLCFNVFSSPVNPWILTAASWWGGILTLAGPLFSLMESLSSLIVAQKLGQEGKKLIERDSEIYQFSFLITSAAAYVTSAWWIVAAYPAAASSPLSSTLLGVALTALVFLTFIGFVLRRTNIIESSSLALFVAYNVWLCGIDQDQPFFLEAKYLPLIGNLKPHLEALQNFVVKTLPKPVLINLLYRLSILHIASRILPAIGSDSWESENGVDDGWEERPTSKLTHILLSYRQLLFVTVYSNLLLLDHSSQIWWRWILLFFTLIMWAVEFPSKILYERPSAPPRHLSYCIIEGRVKIGLANAELERLANPSKQGSVAKISRRDIAPAIAKKADGGLTCSATLIFAAFAGIKVFATGGLGGVHRGGESSMDISADLHELGRCPVGLVSSGVKSILDIGRTLEYLETLGVPVVPYGSSKEFPAFFSPRSGFDLPWNAESPSVAANILHVQTQLRMPHGVLFAVPIPAQYEADGATIQQVVEQAVAESEANGVSRSGKGATPWLLKRISELTNGTSETSNIALLENNALVGGQIAVEYQKLVQEPSSTNYSPFVPQTTQASSPPTDIYTHQPKAAKLAVVGAAAVDISARAFSISPNSASGGSTAPGSIFVSLGGVGRNVAEAATHTSPEEGSVLLISAIGDDAFGDKLAKDTRNIGMRTDGLLLQKDQRTAVCNMIMDREGILSSNRQMAKKNTDDLTEGDLITGIADMAITEALSADEVIQILRRARPVIIAMDANSSPDVISKISQWCASQGIKVFFEPTSVAKSTRILEAVEAMQNATSSPIDFISPNILELRQIFASVTDGPVDLTSDPNYWAALDNLSLTSQFRMDLERLARVNASQDSSKGTLSFLVDQGLAQMAIKLLPFFRHIVVKCGDKGVFVVMRTSGQNPESKWHSVKTNIQARYIVSHGTTGETAVVAHFPVSLPENVVNVTGAGDSLVGALVSCLAQRPHAFDSPSALQEVIDIGQRAALLTLGSDNAVSARLSELRNSHQSLRVKFCIDQPATASSHPQATKLDFEDDDGLGNSIDIDDDSSFSGQLPPPRPLRLADSPSFPAVPLPPTCPGSYHKLL